MRQTILLLALGAASALPFMAAKQVAAGDKIPGYLAAQGALKDRGIDEVMVFCVNDGAVMTAWSKDQGADDSLLTFYGDPAGKLTKALGVLLDHPGRARAC
ncbi:peroxiredoxin [Aureococcus anophagefferens]|nr:peroxiredoxin [Aureococcus anophagefferens]